MKASKGVHSLISKPLSTGVFFRQGFYTFMIREKNGRIDPNIYKIDTSAGKGIGSIQAQYFVSIL